MPRKIRRSIIGGTPIVDYTDRYWSSDDGLKLHYRDYPGEGGALPLICIPGLTRNARDFEPLAGAIGNQNRLLCVELRGRGQSEYAPEAASYHPLQYVDDVLALLRQAEIDRFVAIGTSLGGIVTMLLAASGKANIAGALLNDIGPELDPAGIDRIKNHVGQGGSFPTWMHAARALAAMQSCVFPQYEAADWLRFAKRCMTLGQNGRIAFDYDMRIAEPFNQATAADGADLWQPFKSLSICPVTVLRGELSDLLTIDTAQKMARTLRDCEIVTVPQTGHAPSFEEPVSVQAVQSLLSRIE